MMRIHKGLVLLALAATPTMAAAQLTGGGSGVAPQQGQQEEVQTESNFGARTSLRGGTVSASGTYGSLPERTGFVYFTEAQLEETFATGSGAGTGYFAELTRVQPLFTPHPMANIGFRLALSGAVVDVDWAAIQEAEDDEMEEVLPDGIFDARIGPSITVNPFSSLMVDLSYTLGIGIAAGTSFTQPSFQATSDTYYIDDLDDADEYGTGRSRAFEVAVSFGPLQVGWQAHSVDDTRNRIYSYSGDTRSGEIKYQVETPTTTSRVFLGLTF